MGRLSRGYSLLLPGLMLGLGLATSRLAAQAAAIVVRDGAAGPPVAGAIVRLLLGDSVISQALTSEAGRVTLRALSAGRYVLRVSRIGYNVGGNTPIDLVAGETTSVELTSRWNQIFLPEIIVEGRMSCGKATEERAIAATLWEQIRQALVATSLTEGSDLTLNTRTVDRMLSASGAIRDEQSSPVRLTGSRPFLPLSPARLAQFGYVRADADSVVYNAPDADLLLSDPFVETHCFGVRSGPKGDSLAVGLTFEPVKSRRVADIRGVLWVNRHSLELRSLEFHYVSSAQSVLESNAWGRLEFDRLPSGAWYIRSWFIRMPEIERSVVRTTFHDAVVGFREHGGSAEPLTGPRQPMLAARLRGRVIDSLAGGGLAGVVVSVAGAPEFAVTDSLGAYALAVPVSGTRLVTFSHPLLSRDSLLSQRVVEFVSGEVATASTSTPGPTVMLRTLCPGAHGTSGLLGRIVTTTGAAAPSVYVRAEWPQSGLSYHEVTATNDAGLWSFCDLPSRTSVTLRVGSQRGGGSAGSVEIEEGRFHWLTLVAAQADMSRIARVDSAQRLPDIKTTASVPVSPGQRFLSELRDRIQRNGAPPSALITRDELEKSGSFRLASLLVLHGLKERVNKYGKQTLTCPRKAERPAIFVDGLLLDGSDNPAAKRFRVGAVGEIFDMENMTPDEVEAVEIYRSPGEWPAEFDRTEASCVVLIWTRRGEKQP